MNPYVFFAGCSRSGTTLLRRIGNAHPELAIAREQHWLPRYWELRIGITPEGYVTPVLLDMLSADRRFPSLELPYTRFAGLVEGADPVDYATFVTRLFDLHGEVVGKRLVGEKTPGYVRHLPTLHSLWPCARVVHLIRDGHDVALSLLDWSKSERNVGRFSTWRRDRVATTALYWEWNLRLGREASALLGAERYLELRYETLVAQPELACRTLCDFLTLAYDPAMLRFHEGRTRSKPGLSAKKAWAPVTPGLRKWREQMSPDDVVRFEATAGDLLEELGYERQATVTAEDLARGARLREKFAESARVRGLPIPRAWEGLAA